MYGMRNMADYGSERQCNIYARWPQLACAPSGLVALTHLMCSPILDAGSGAPRSRGLPLTIRSAFQSGTVTPHAFTSEHDLLSELDPDDGTTGTEAAHTQILD